MQTDLKSPQEMLLKWEAERSNRICLRQPANGVFREFTWEEAMDQARRLAAALREMGLEPGDRVGLFSKNCAEWMIADYAIMLGGFVSVPVYATANAKTLGHVLSHSEAKAVFVGELEQWESLQGAIPDGTVSIGMPYRTMPTQTSWDELLKKHQPMHEPHIPDIDDVMTLLYTSGSTGLPKGAVQSYRNFASVGTHIGKLLEVTEHERCFSYLPLAHCTERAYVQATGVYYASGSVSFHERLETFFDDLKAVKPTLFGSVPRLWKRFQLGVVKSTPQQKLDKLLKIPFIKGMTQRKIRQALGLDQARWFGSGSAPIAPALLEWWETVGVPIREGWGMTETFAYGTQLGPRDATRIGTIGKALPGVELKVGEGDELLIKSPGMMLEYYLDPKKTEESFEDGFFKTGDCASIDSDGYVRITGRAKEIFKTAKGKYVAPVPIESRFAQDAYIEQACVIGLGLKQPVAVVQLTEDAAEVSKDTVADDLEKRRQSVNAALEPHEKVDRILVVSEPWTIENGMLTPTLKVKRNLLEKQYEALIADESRSGVIWA